MKMLHVKILRQCWLGDRNAMVGEVHEINESLARQLVGANQAVETSAPKPKRTAKVAAD